MNYWWCPRVSGKHGLILPSQVNSILCPPPVFRATLLYRRGVVVGHCGTGHNFGSKTGFLGTASQCSEKYITVFILNHRAPKQAPAQRSSSLKGHQAGSFTKCLYFRKKNSNTFAFQYCASQNSNQTRLNPQG